jgi:hypothetical protein
MQVAIVTARLPRGAAAKRGVQPLAALVKSATLHQLSCHLLRDARRIGVVELRETAHPPIALRNAGSRAQQFSTRLGERRGQMSGLAKQHRQNSVRMSEAARMNLTLQQHQQGTCVQRPQRSRRAATTTFSASIGSSDSSVGRQRVPAKRGPQVRCNLFLLVALLLPACTLGPPPIPGSHKILRYRPRVST